MQEDEGSSRQVEGLCKSKEELKRVYGWRGLVKDFSNECSHEI